MIGLPPSEPGGAHLTWAEAFPGVADTPEGAAGTVNGWADVGDEAGPCPTEFTAETVKV